MSHFVIAGVSFTNHFLNQFQYLMIITSSIFHYPKTSINRNSSVPVSSHNLSTSKYTLSLFSLHLKIIKVVDIFDSLVFSLFALRVILTQLVYFPENFCPLIPNESRRASMTHSHTVQRTNTNLLLNLSVIRLFFYKFSGKKKKLLQSVRMLWHKAVVLLGQTFLSSYLKNKIFHKAVITHACYTSCPYNSTLFNYITKFFITYFSVIFIF